MKKIIYGSLFLALVGIGIVGCKKETATNSTTRFSNPYDYIGKKHNEVLNLCLNDKSYYNLSNFEQHKWINNKMLSGNGSSGEFNLLSDELLHKFDNERKIWKDNDDLLYFYDSIVLVQPKSTHFYLNESKNICCKYQNDVSLIEFKNELSKLENKAFIDNRLTKNEKFLVLGSLSLIKNSYEFWKMKENEVNITKKGKLGRWLADAGGFIVGAGSVMFFGYYTNTLTNEVYTEAGAAGLGLATSSSAAVGNE